MKWLVQLFKIFNNWKWHYLLSSFLLIVSVFILSLEPKLAQYIIDILKEARSNDADISKPIPDYIYAFSKYFFKENLSPFKLIIILTSGILIFSIIRNFIIYVSNRLSILSSENATEKLRDSLFERLIKSDLSQFSNLSQAALVQRCTQDIEEIKDFAQNHFVHILNFIALFIFSILMIWTIFPPLITINLFFFSLTILNSSFAIRFQKRSIRVLNYSRDKINNHFLQTLKGIDVVKSYNLHEEKIKKLNNLHSDKYNYTQKSAKVNSIYLMTSMLIVAIQIFISIFVGGYLVLNNKITLGGFISFYSYQILMHVPLRNLTRTLNSFGNSIISLERINEILLQKDIKESKNSTKKKSEFIPKIEFKNVWFKYLINQDYLFKDLSFTINPGEKVAIIGPSSSGKTSISKLLCKSFKHQNGSIIIGGSDINNLSQKEIFQFLRVFPQDPFLFSITLKENIGFRNNLVSENKIRESAKVSTAESFINKLPNQYDFLVKEKGENFSGGEIQRISFARSILDAPDVLFFDDVTSSLDIMTEQILLQRLHHLIENKTCIFVSNRPSVLKYVNRILLFDKGQIQKEYTYNEILNQKEFLYNN